VIKGQNGGTLSDAIQNRLIQIFLYFLTGSSLTATSMPQSFGNFAQLRITQTVLLKLTGFLPLQKNEAISTTFCKWEDMLATSLSCVAVSLLCGTLFFSCFESTMLFYVFLYPTSNSSYQRKVGLLEILERLPFCAMNFRGLIVMSVCFAKRNHWSDLFKETASLISRCFDDKLAKQRLFRQIKYLSTGLLIMTFCIHLLWKTVKWIDYLSAENITLSSDGIAGPLPIKMLTWQYIVLDYLFRAVPFVLSQQVYVCAIMLVVTLSGALQNLTEQMNREKLVYQLGIGQNINEKGWKKTEANLKKWKNIHFDMLRLTDRLNTFFRLIFFITFRLDLLTLLCFASWIITGKREMISYAFSSGSVLLFGIYVTFFPLPMVIVYEKV
jgi:hypothetical protein